MRSDDPDGADFYREEGLPMPRTYAAAVERTIAEARNEIAARVAPAIVRLEHKRHQLTAAELVALEDALAAFLTLDGSMTPERKGDLRAFLTFRTDMRTPPNRTPRQLADSEAEDWRQAGFTARVYTRALCAEGERLDVICVVVRDPVDLSTATAPNSDPENLQPDPDL